MGVTKPLLLNALAFSLIIGWVGNGVSAAVQLEGYNVDPTSVTVSGLSAGGAMATQFHFAFSSEVFGVGVYAGLPYTCGKGGIADASQCMSIPDFFAPINSLIAAAQAISDQGTIDHISNIANSSVYVFHGTADYTVNKGNGVKVEQMYNHFGARVESNLEMNANHGFPTDFYGAACSASSAATQYINNCNYNGAFAMFDFLYGGGLTQPVTGGGLPPGDLLEFDQAEFITSGSPASISMDSIGFAYIPTGCKDRSRTCRLHIAFHGCVQSRTTAGIGDAYATKTGYIHAAEENNIIVIFPQTVAMGTTNPNACFDWWGYLSPNFLTKQGAQMTAVQKMMHRVLDCPTCVPADPSTTTTTPSPGGSCGPNEVVFSPYPQPGMCQFYMLCACGGNPVLLQCAPGLYYDDAIKGCNFQQLVQCDPSLRSNNSSVY